MCICSNINELLAPASIIPDFISLSLVVGLGLGIMFDSGFKLGIRLKCRELTAEQSSHEHKR